MATNYQKPAATLKLYQDERERGRSSYVGVCVRNTVQGKWHVTESFKLSLYGLQHFYILRALSGGALFYIFGWFRG